MKNLVVGWTFTFAVLRGIDLYFDEKLVNGYRYFPHGYGWVYAAVAAFCGLFYAFIEHWKQNKTA